MKYLLIAAAMTSGAAAAQADPIEQCRNSSATNEARILCLEEALRVNAEPTEESGSVSLMTDDTGASAETAIGESPEKAVAGLGAEQVIARIERTTEEGRSKRKQRLEEETLEGIVVDFAFNAAGNLVVVLDNGQVWAQRGGDKQRVKLREESKPEVRIRRGMISGYRMEIDEPDITLIVERLK